MAGALEGTVRRLAVEFWHDSSRSGTSGDLVLYIVIGSLVLNIIFSIVYWYLRIRPTPQRILGKSDRVPDELVGKFRFGILDFADNLLECCGFFWCPLQFVSEFFYRMGLLHSGNDKPSGSGAEAGCRWAGAMLAFIFLGFFTGGLLFFLLAVAGRMAIMDRFGMPDECADCCLGCLLCWFCPCLVFAQDYGQLKSALASLDHAEQVPKAPAIMVGVPAGVQANARK